MSELDSRAPQVHKIKTLSPVWLVPIVALLIALSLAYQSWREKGPTIDISFSKAEGIEPKRTKIRYKDVDVGTVESVRVSKDLTNVIVSAELAPEFSDHLSSNTQFWVVSPRISLSGVSGLNTLLSGVYIEMDLGEKGKSQYRFNGLSEAPRVRSDTKGESYTLFTRELRSLDVGSPVYHRQIKVGEVTSYRLAPGDEDIELSLFVEAPYDQLVTERSRFWSVSGVEVELGADGINAHVESLNALIAGGIAFDSPPASADDSGERRIETFYLLPNKKAVLEGGFITRYRYAMNFVNQSVRGLRVGAPVEHYGIKVGEVLSISFKSVEKAQALIQVVVDLQPERVAHVGLLERPVFESHLSEMINNGLRAQLKTGSLLTGGLIIDLVNTNDTKEQLTQGDTYTLIPTIPGEIDQFTKQLASIAHKIDRFPIERIGNDLAGSLNQLNSLLAQLNNDNFSSKVTNTLANIETASSDLNKVVGSAVTSLEQLEKTLNTMEESIAPDSELYYELLETLKSVGESADSVRQFTDELNRHPQSLILGK